MDPDLGVCYAIGFQWDIHLTRHSMILHVLLEESDLTQEIAMRMNDTNKEEGKRGTNRGVDTILNGRENSDKYGSQPDQEFEGRNMPEGVSRMA